jgi:membrane protein YdbS with pleckstrin-like domain
MNSMDREPEAIVARMRPHGRALVLPSILLIVVVGAAAYFVWWFPEPWMSWAVLVAAAAVVVFGFIVPVAVWLGRSVTITTRRTVVHEGGLVRRRREVLHTRPLEVVVRRTPGQRLAGSGDVVLELGADRRIVLHDLPNPVLVQEALADLMAIEHADHNGRRRTTGEIEGRRGPAHAE